MNEVTVSVILPVYNVAPWIGECIESLRKQKQPGLEFIFVDDRSTDNSVEIIESFVKEDPRAHLLINDANSGSGFSRNRGIEVAKGEYLSFIDPDDSISDDFYEVLYTKAKETGCDIVKGLRARFEDGMQREEIVNCVPEFLLNTQIQQRVYTGEQLYNAFRYEHQTAIFKSSFVKANDIRYGLSRVAQDVTFLLKACSYAKDIETTDNAIYYYRQRPGAVTSNYSLNRSLAQLDALEERVVFAKGLKLSDGMVSYYSRNMNDYLSLFYYATTDNDISKEEQSAYHERFKKILGSTDLAADILEFAPEIEVFANHGYIIPTIIRKDKKNHSIRVDRWTDFFTLYPEYIKNTYYRAYAFSTKTMFSSFKKSDLSTRTAAVETLKHLKVQFKKLKAKDRARILYELSLISGLKITRKIFKK